MCPDTVDLPDEALLRTDLPLPELAEVDVVRHYMHLSQLQLQRGRAAFTRSAPAR